MFKRMPTTRTPAIRRPVIRILAGLVLGAGGAASVSACGPQPQQALQPPPPAVFVPPLHDAAVGEELLVRRGATAWRWRVASADEQFVAVEVQEYENDIPRGPLQGYRWNRNGFGLPEEFVVREIARDRITVGDRAWDCWRLTVRGSKSTRWYWLSDAVPVHGVLRIAVDLNNRGAPDLANPADYAEIPK